MDEIEFYYNHVIKPLQKEIIRLKENSYGFICYYKYKKLLKEYEQKLKQCYSHLENLLENNQKK